MGGVIDLHCHLLAGIDTAALGYKCTEHAASEHATHVVLSK